MRITKKKIDQSRNVIDGRGFRLNVGIILMNNDHRIFWGKRTGRNAWQFPQGGMKAQETPEEAMYRELKEEIGLNPEDVHVMGVTQGWLYYRLPRHFMRQHTHPTVIGQKQKWFLLKLTTDDTAIRLDTDSTPEFDDWRWVDYWHPLSEVIYFKKNVYRRALKELEPLFLKGDCEIA